jgi:HAD superfamily hydrolase (TIGR01459 family)
MSVRVIPGVAKIAGDYDAFILDLWGVLYDGGQVFPWALRCMDRLRAGGVRLAILSNGPRRASVVAERVTAAGIAPAHYDFILSSGEEAWQYLSGNRADAWYAGLGRRCYFIGQEADRAMLDGLKAISVDTVAGADFLLVCGPPRPGDVIEDYETVLGDAAASGLPMVCANPDLVVHRLGEVEICAGTIAERYAALGGDVRWHGKPHRSVYQSCLERLAPVERARVLVVGDSFRTDIKGANRAGLASLLVAGGIHGQDLCEPGGAPDAGRIDDWAARARALPDYACGLFEW